MIKYDAIVIGAGHNGLVAAAYLARAGQYVLVLEGREQPGGTMSTTEVFPGFIYHRASPSLDWLPDSVARDLELERYGLDIMSPDPAVCGLLPGGDYLMLAHDAQETAAAIRRFSTQDAGLWGAFCEHATRLSGFLPALYAVTPPRVTGANLADAWPLLGLGGPLLRLGQAGATELLRTLPMSVEELLAEWFEGDLLRGVVGSSGIRAICQGPYASGTAYVLLHHLIGSPGRGFRAPRFARGGTGSVVGRWSRLPGAMAWKSAPGPRWRRCRSRTAARPGSCWKAGRRSRPRALFRTPTRGGPLWSW